MVSRISNDAQKVKMIVTLLFALSLSLPLLSLMSDFGVNGILRENAPNGQFYYLVSKLFGMVALVLLWWQIIFAVKKNSYITTKQHIVLGMSFVTLVLLHVLLFVTAISIRNGHLSLDILMPGFTSGYYKIATSLGVLALIILCVSVVSGFLKIKSATTNSYGHKLVFFVAALVIMHAYMIGSDIQSGFLKYVFYSLTTSMFLVVAFNIKKII